MMLIRYFGLIFFILFIYTTSGAQEKYDITYSFEQDSIRIKGNNTFTNSIKISNTSDKDVVLKVAAEGSKALMGLLKIPPSIAIPAKNSLTIYLKYFANSATITHKIQQFSLSFHSDDKLLRIQKEDSFYTVLEEDSQITLLTSQDEYFIPAESNEFQFIINALNTGLVTKTFRLQLTEVPEGLEFSGDLLSQTLASGAQYSFIINVKNRRKKTIEDFEVIIRAIGERGEDIGFKKIRVVTASSVKRLGSTGLLGAGAMDNMFGLKYSTINNSSSIYQMQGHGDIGLNKTNKLTYQVNMDYYQNNGGLNLYNTWAELDGNRLNIRIGNLYQDLDYSLNGKGIKVKYKFEGDKSLSVFGLENNYMLYSDWQNRIPTEKIVGMEYAWNTSNFRKGHVSFIQSHDPYKALDISQFNIKHSFIGTETAHLAVEGGYSIARKDDADSHKAWALGVDYNQQWSKYQVNNSFYYSSPYYTGLRKGLTLLQSRISTRIGLSGSLSARVSIQRLEPKLIDRITLFDENISDIRIYELGWQQAFKSGNFSIRPYWMEQSLRSPAVSWHSKAIRSIIDLGLYKGKHRFNINSDVGYVKGDIQSQPNTFYSVRLNGSYNYGIFGVSGYLQKNPYYLSELYGNTNSQEYSIYSIGPTLNLLAFKQRLEIQVSSSYNYYTAIVSKNITVNSNARWKLSNGWHITGEAFISRLNNTLSQKGYIENTQFRAGIEHHFSPIRKRGGKELKLVYYEDRNNNGEREKEERGISGIVVRIKDQTAITDANGTVRFLNMIDGDYNVQIISTKDWGGGNMDKLVITKNTAREIGLMKTIPLKGRIEVVQNKYEQTNPLLGGIKIEAMDSNGKRYSTLSDNDGYYAFYLPCDKYMVSINTEGLPFSIENPNNGINLNEEPKKDYTLNFKYIDQHRKVEVKQF